MTGALKLLLSLAVLLAAAEGDVLNANDLETCVALCASCDGVASFERGICRCSVREDDAKGLDCISRLRRESEDLGLDAASESPENAERSARCSLLGSRRRIASADADRVANYFMKGGPMTGSPLLGSARGACPSAPEDPLTGAINIGNAKPRPAEARPESSPDAGKSPAVAAPAPSRGCSSPVQYQPIVSSSWQPSQDAVYGPMIGAPHAYQTSGFYPHMLGAIPHMVMAIPNAMMRAAAHIPSHHPGQLGASQHSPLLASLASGTHGVLQRLDKMVAPYASENQHNKMVGAPLHQTSDCGHPSSSYPASMLGAAPAGASAPTARSDNSHINASMLQKVLAHQNSLLEALSQQLKSIGPQVGAPRMLQYAPMGPESYVLGAPQPMGQYASQPMGQYCPDGSSGSSTVGSPRTSETSPKPTEDSPKEAEKVAAPKATEDKDSADSKVASKEPEVEKKKSEDAKKSEEAESPKTKRETRTRSSSRKKRGDVRYAKKLEAVVPQTQSS